jgi:ferrous iron transport protein B
MVRYDWIESLLDGILTRPTQRMANWSDRIDRVLTHRIMGSIVFILVMIMIFQAVYVGADPLVGVLEAIQGTIAEFVTARMPEGALRSLLVDGLIGGVGGVITFLPQILILFLFISILEDCGYMARAAYLMDKLMSRVGLSGKSFIPLLSSFACAIPGVMATRVIENRRDRLTTILIAPLMSCSARVPVYTLLIAAFIPNRTYLGGLLGLQGLTMLAMYFLGAIAAVVVAWILKKTLLQGPTPPFVMELPGYKWPSIVTVVHRVFSQGWAFVYRAGTLIVAVSVVVWAASYYPRDPSIEAPHAPRVAELEAELESLPEDSDQAVAASNELTEIDNVIRGAHQRNSYLGRAGHWIEPVVRPLGWDWRLGCAAIASFPAREVVVATLGIIYNLGDDIDLVCPVRGDAGGDQT